MAVVQVHPSDEKLDRYIHGRLGPPDSVPVLKIEEHLFRCTHCVLKAERSLEYGQSLREALSTLRHSWKTRPGTYVSPPSPDH